MIFGKFTNFVQKCKENKKDCFRLLRLQRFFTYLLPVFTVCFGGVLGYSCFPSFTTYLQSRCLSLKPSFNEVPTSSEAAEENRKVNFSLILRDLASSESQFFKRLIGLETTLLISIIYESNICFCFLLFFVLFVISNVKL